MLGICEGEELPTSIFLDSISISKSFWFKIKLLTIQKKRK